MNAKFQESMPVPTRFTQWGTLDEFYHKDVQRVLEKWFPRIPAQKIIDVTLFLLRISNVSLRPDLWEEDKESRGGRFLKYFYEHPAFFAELIWQIEKLHAVPLHSRKNKELLALVDREVPVEYRGKSESFFSALAARASELKGKEIAVGTSKNARPLEVARRRRIGEKWNLRIAGDHKKSGKV